MEALPPNTPEALIDLQHIVQRKLGCCLLRLQQYETMLKALVAHSDIAVSPAQFQTPSDVQLACTQKKTLGTLVGMLTGSYLTLSQADEAATHDETAGDGPWLRLRYQLELSPEQYESTTAVLKELVDLRNELVHHFLQRFNIGAAKSCAAANAYLDASYDTIDDHFLTLHGWAQATEEARMHMASLVSSPAFEDFLVNGTRPDGPVNWPTCGAVACLREAESRFEVDGWTQLNTATAWIRSQYPEQQPHRYGCGSWRQVIHESRQFEVRKQTNPDNGCGEVWYRSR